MRVNLATELDFFARGIAADRWTASALAAASAAVLDAAGGPVGQTSGTVALVGSSRQWLDIPTPAVVTAVTVDGVAVDDWTAFPHALFRAQGWGDPSVVAVTGTFGYGVVPADVVQLVVDLTVMASASEALDPRVESEQIDDYRITYTPGAITAVEIPEGTRRMLRAQFGGSAAVTGSR